MMVSEEDPMELVAATRRERLKALKTAQELLETPDGSFDHTSDSMGDKSGNLMMAVEHPSDQTATPHQESQDTLQNAKEISKMTDVISTSPTDFDIEGKNEKESNLQMRFRNYVPQDKQLQEHRVAPPVLPKFEDSIPSKSSLPTKDEDPFLNIAPKKPNWDLKRDVQQKLNKLERRTQKALYKLMEEQEKEKLANQISAQ